MDNTNTAAGEALDATGNLFDFFAAFEAAKTPETLAAEAAVFALVDAFTALAFIDPDGDACFCTDLPVACILCAPGPRGF
jgi:hypothetical protein